MYRGPRAFRFSMLSSLYVAASMPPGVETRILDEDVEPIDFDAEADLVGVSFMTYNARRAYEIADVFRARGKPVVFGGYHPSFLPGEAVRHADAVCVGEAEGSVPQMIADFRGGSLKPVYRSAPVSLAGLPIPDRGLIHQAGYITPDAVQATRGCPHMCTFCSVTAFAQHRFRTRPVDEVVDEVKRLGRWLIFMDDNIIGNRDYAKELFARLAPLNRRWCSQCGVRIADDTELLDLARKSGCVALFIGLESLSDGNLRACRKPVSRARDYARAIARLHATGIGVYAGFVFGMADDDEHIFPRTLEFLGDARVDVAQLTILTPFPGTPLFDEMERQGRIRSLDWSLYGFGHVVFEPKHMSAEALQAGADWVGRRCYSGASTWRRVARTLGYLPPSVVLRTMLPLSLGHRQRRRAYAFHRRGAATSRSSHLKGLRGGGSRLTGTDAQADARTRGPPAPRPPSALRLTWRCAPRPPRYRR